MKLGCIGYGNMATAILGGVLSSEMLTANDIFVYELSEEKQKNIADKGMNCASSINELLVQSSVILLSVKPNNFPEILDEIKKSNNKSQSFISIAAGISIKKIQSSLGEKAPIIRAMPNTPLLVGAGTTALCHNDFVTKEIFDFAKQLFASSGSVYELPESDFNNVINLNGSSPAFDYYFTKIIVDYVTENSNIPPSVALSMFCDTLVGSAKMMTKTGLSLDELITMVSSPNGTTIAAIEAFKATGFEKSLQTGLAACVKRAEELGKA